jgi:hypothetical protein
MKIIQIIIILFFSNICNSQTDLKSKIIVENAPWIVYEIGIGNDFENPIKIKFAKNLVELKDAENKYFESMYLENKYGKLNLDWLPVKSDFFEGKGKKYNLIYIMIYNKRNKSKRKIFKTIYFDVTDCVYELQNDKNKN